MSYKYKGRRVVEDELERELQRIDREEMLARISREKHYYGVPDKYLPQDWLDQRPHALWWNRKWID